MGQDRYDTEYGRQDRDRWSDDRHSRHEGRGQRDERGFFERAGEEIASWFGSDDDRDRHGHRQHPDRERAHGSGDHRESRPERGGWLSGDRDHRNRGRDLSDRSREPSGRGADDRHEWFGGRSQERGNQDRGDRGGFRSDAYRSEREESFRSHGDRDYRPVTGDYGRGASDSRGAFGSRDREPRRDRTFDQQQRERGFSNWDRDDQRRTSFAGSSERSQHHDPHYQQWRERHLQELDRDYHDYHRERQSRFEDDFGGWRDRRQQKRSLLGQVRERAEVVGKDGEHVGTVDKVAGDRIILTRSDPAAGGHHHSIACTQVDRVEDGRVILDVSAEQARNRWRDEDRSRALFERHDQGEAGPGILDRSFSGTYRD